MQSKEFRQGNLIGYQEYIRVVEAIMPNKIKMHGAETFKLMDDYEPIKIDLDLLFKFHFKPVRENVYEYKWNKSRIRIERLAGAYWLKSSAGTTESRPLKYAHEIQNLFYSLSGEELTLKQ